LLLQAQLVKAVAVRSFSASFLKDALHLVDKIGAT
jgi:hypothetical protein